MIGNAVTRTLLFITSFIFAMIGVAEIVTSIMNMILYGNELLNHILISNIAIGVIFIIGSYYGREAYFKLCY